MPGGLTDLDPQLQELAVDARDTPQRVLAAHAPDQLSHFLGQWRSPPSSRPGFPSPKQPKASSVPANDGVRLDHDDDVQAARPQMIEPDPEIPVEPVQPRTGCPFALEHQQLMAKRNEFELQRGPVSKAW